MENFCPEVRLECPTSTPKTQGEANGVGIIPCTNHWIFCIQSFTNRESKIVQIKSRQDKTETLAEDFLCIIITIESAIWFYL